MYTYTSSNNPALTTHTHISHSPDGFAHVKEKTAIHKENKNNNISTIIIPNST